MSATSQVTSQWRPGRRAFLQTAGAALVMVQVGVSWPGTDGAAVAAMAGTRSDTGIGLRPAPLRRAATAGPPAGRAHGNVIVHRTTIDGAPFTVWYGDGGRAMAIGEQDGTTVAWYIDPTRRVAADTVGITPLAELGQEIRSHFGEREWIAMQHAAGS